MAGVDTNKHLDACYLLAASSWRLLESSLSRWLGTGAGNPFISLPDRSCSRLRTFVYGPHPPTLTFSKDIILIFGYFVFLMFCPAEEVRVAEGG